MSPYSANDKGYDPSTSSAAELDEGYDSSALATSPCHDANAPRPPGTALSCFTVTGNGARELDAEENDRRENEKEAAREGSAEDVGKREGDDKSELILEELAEEYHAFDDERHGYDDAMHVNDDERHEYDDERHVNDDERHEYDDERHVNDDERHEYDDEMHVNDDERHEYDDGPSDDGRGYEFWPEEEEEAEKAMLEEAEEEMQERSAAEEGVADEAAKGRQRGQSWVSSVEWFVSWPLRRLSHPWRKVRRE
ncbi:unnamed protein product [Closterium sp. NIES-53]